MSYVLVIKPISGPPDNKNNATYRSAFPRLVVVIWYVNDSLTLNVSGKFKISKISENKKSSLSRSRYVFRMNEAVKE